MAIPNTLLKKHLTSNVITALSPTNDDTRFKFATLPYVKGVSECLQRVFRSNNVKLCFKANSTFGSQLTKLKDRMEKGEISDIVY